ncbi:MAG: hypothetical protein AAFN94_14850 [Pseudomonadota bacterium]
MRFILPLIATFALSACVTTIAEERGTITFGLETYDTVTRTFQREDGSTYARTTIRLGAERVSCRANDPVDCRAAINQRQFSRSAF